jgi:hypothetical protein
LKPIRSSLLLLLAVVVFAPLAGCGADPDPDSQQVLDTALSRQSLLAPPVGPAGIEVASLGFEDAVLKTQRLKIDAGTNRTVREALAGSAGGAERGLAGLIDDLATGGSTELDGVEVESVTGVIDVTGLIDRIRPLAESPGARGSADIPGLGELDQLEQSLVAADFELFADPDDGSLERFDLILSLDDPGNSLPPSRIRFSLTDAQPGGGTP